MISIFPSNPNPCRVLWTEKQQSKGTFRGIWQWPSSTPHCNIQSSTGPGVPTHGVCFWESDHRAEESPSASKQRDFNVQQMSPSTQGMSSCGTARGAQEVQGMRSWGSCAQRCFALCIWWKFSGLLSLWEALIDAGPRYMKLTSEKSVSEFSYWKHIWPK